MATTKCPECDHSFKPSGFMTQEAHEERLKKKTAQVTAKEAEIGLLKDALQEAKDSGSEAEELREKLTAATTELSGIKEAAEVSEAFAAAGVNPELVDSFRSLYASAIAGEDEPAPFAEWVQTDAAKTHPLLAPHYTAPTDPSEPGTPAPPSTPATPRATASVVPPATGTGPQNATDLQQLFASPAYQSLEPAEQRAKLAELRNSMGQG